MQVEDSYEGAMLRLQRLEQAGLVQAPQPKVDDDELFARMRDLEELASMACDENERLKEQLGEAQSEIARVREELSRTRSEIEGTRDELAHAHGQLTGARDQILSLQRVLEEESKSDNQVIRLERELHDARDQIGSLQRIVHMLEESAAEPEPLPPQPTRSVPAFLTQPAPAPVEPALQPSVEQAVDEAGAQHYQPPAEQQPMFPEIDEDPLAAYNLATKKKSVWPFVAISLAVAGLGALLAARPWAQPTSMAAAVALPPPVAPLPPPAPVVAAPAAPIAAPAAAPIAAPAAARINAPVAATIPKVTVPTVAVPKVQPPKAQASRARKEVARRHAAAKPKKHVAKKEKEVAGKKEWTHTSDPLGGLNL